MLFLYLSDRLTPFLKGENKVFILLDIIIGLVKPVCQIIISIVCTMNSTKSRMILPNDIGQIIFDSNT